ncbi:O-antigen ligase [Arthrobacter sp. ISL-65]|uniref:O-antigen ligase family protein n=1 Tax=Arthrobacter sp. ISL-65 TaxID=2819112 RepID=UPI001BEB4C13|nr:O-antigen ligase family protein [Arthrobacter sp. ISL-65]MBT2549612.1 O-antigen ligase family protein [Arthrobacter sp. ISL-65]
MRDVGWFLGVSVAALAAGVFAGLEPLWATVGLAAVVFLALLNRTYKKFIRGRTVNAAPWSLVLLAFPLVCSFRAVNSTVALVGMVGLLGVTLLSKPPAGNGPANKLPLVLMGVAMVAVVVRPTSLQSGLFIAFAFIVLVRAINRTTRHSAVTSLIDGVGLYLIANVAAYYVLGMRSSAAALRTGGLESADGGVRVLYPLSTSLNLPPIMAAAFLAASLLLMERGGKKAFRLLAVAAAVTVLVSAESRTALVVAFLIALASLTVPRILRGLAVPIALGSVLFVFVYPAISKTLVAPLIAAATNAIPFLSRASGSSDASLNGREVIWSRSSRFWVEKASDWGQIFGFGSQGQYESGASRTYAHIFGESIRNPYMTSTHNSVLQQLFDGGVIGAVCLVAAVIACLRLWVMRSRINEPYTAAALAASVSLVISSVTEVSLAPGMGQETLLVFVGLLVAACAGEPSESQEGGALDNRPGRVLPARPVAPYRLPERDVVGHRTEPSLGDGAPQRGR